VRRTQLGIHALLLTGAIVATSVSAWAQADNTSRIIGDNESVFIDGRTFKVTPGTANGNAASQIKALGARKLGPGALIFRSGSDLYVVDSPLRLPGAVTAGHPSVQFAAPAEQANRVRIEYLPAKKPELQKIHDELKRHRGLETLQMLFSPFRLPRELTIRSQECGIVNAWYRLEDSGPAITICYEYMDHIMRNLPDETMPSGITQDDAMIGQFFYVAIHEFGHAIFDLYNVSVFGREEDAADQIAAYILLKLENTRALVGGAAYGYKMYVGAAFSYEMFMSMMKKKPQVMIPLAAFSSTHGQPEQRFYNLLCAAYGTDPKTFQFLVDNGSLPKTRAPSCEVEIYKLRKAFDREIRPHIDLQLASKVLMTNWMMQLAGAPPEAMKQ
jgi:hypothetical protein